MSEKSKKIYIDFQSGSHGNYLEWVCNRFLADIPTYSPLPFNSRNAAHHKHYLSEPLFECGHFTTNGLPLSNETVISIHIDVDDLLPLQCISLLRARPYIEPEALEIDTYHKLHNKDYQCVLDNLLDSFFNDRDLVAGYEAIADSSWPKITTRQDYYSLPEHIRRECEEVHGLVVNTLNESHPHCARPILLEFFQIGFETPAEHGLIKAQKLPIHTNCCIYEFPFGCFYDEDTFAEQMIDLSHFLQMPFNSLDQDFRHLHQEFLKRQPYRHAKKICDEIVNCAMHDPEYRMPDLDVIQEGYVRAKLSKTKAP